MGEIEINNRKASHDYKILDTIEAGIELLGTEVKSLRKGQGNLNDAFARIEKKQAWLYQFDIAPYDKAARENHDPKRIRRLLLHREQIRKLFGEVSLKGRSLIALKGYFKKQHFKILLGIATGKTHRDKRQDIIKRDTDRQLRRAIASRRMR